jgi:nitrogen-specific signal transduction histidine kinase/CheY-like chemotaxis protein
MHSVARDITERRQAERDRLELEARIQQIQKLESLGVLAGGIAHDFNNLLVSILGNAGLALMDLPADSPARASLRNIEEAALRASELTKQMLAYSGKGRFFVQPVDLSHVVARMDALVRSSLPPDADLTVALAPDLPPILGDATQLGQVLMNLVANASDALVKGGGRVTIATGTRVMDRSALAATYLDDDLPVGPYATLQVRDSGCGMDAATRAHVFDPFFSTKFPGRGLGMAAVLGIVRGHKAAVRIDSEPGAGTTVTVFFPVMAETTARDSDASPAERRPRGLVLVVDDTAAVAAVAERVLKRAGYQVQVALSGASALELFAARARDVSAVLLDVSMPGMDGLEVLGRLRAMRPDVPVLLSSGFQQNPLAFEGPGVSYLQKPYRLAQLVESIEQAVGADDPRLPLED